MPSIGNKIVFKEIARLTVNETSLILEQLIDEVEATRDAVLKKVAPADDAQRMIRSLANLPSIGPDFATLLVREAFVREFRNRRALGGYVGLGGTPFSSGGSEREQGIGKATGQEDDINLREIPHLIMPPMNRRMHLPRLD